MTRTPTLRFYPALSGGAALPLARYLPPLPRGMVKAWLAENAPPGGWVLDPLGTTPALAMEAARAGYRVIVASNNPILSFMFEMLAAAHPPADFQSALAEISMSRRGDERLDRHIQSLYQTECSRCGEIIAAQAYLWRRGESQPFARLARCPKCGEDGEHPLRPFDLDRLALVGNDALHRARALQRVIMNESEYREDVEQALENYLPRPLSILFTLINRLEGLTMPPEKSRWMQALLISAFDAGNALWPWPAGRARPRQLTVPPQFREHNLWDALEDAVSAWRAPPGERPVAITRWPELPPAGGGISLFRGRVKGLVPLSEEIGPQAVVTAFPRPNQAFWTLAALWSGWLWGHEAALPLRNVLDRRRYDWNWHTTALHSALSPLSRALPPQTPFFGLLPDLAPGFLAAALAACEAAGLHLEGLALQPDEKFAQGLWRPSGRFFATSVHLENEQPPQAMEAVVEEAMRAALLERAEPAPYLTLYTAGMEALTRARAIVESAGTIPGETFTRLQATLTRPFSKRSFLKFYPAEGAHPGGSTPGGSPETPEDERGWWWLANSDEQTAKTTPLTDRVEMEIVRFLQRQPTCTLEEIQQALSRQFPGLLSPSMDLMRACLESYAEPIPNSSGAWRLRAGESSAERRTDLQEMRALLQKTGQQLGFTVSRPSESLIEWPPDWVFCLMASSIVSRFVLASPPGGFRQRVLALPGSRSRLLAYKLRRDPRLAEAMQGWRILKFRHLREIGRQFEARQTVAMEEWLAVLSQDPLTDEATQMPLFDQK